MSLKNFKGYTCVNCGAEYSIVKFRYICDKCESNLILELDFQKIKSKINRKKFNDCKEFSIWRYLDILPINERKNLIPLKIGWTPLYKCSAAEKKLGLKNLFFKDDGRNPSASFKDRAGAVALLNAIENRAMKITGASTGNAASSMACLSAAMGLSPIIFVPKTAPAAKIAQLLIFGAKVFAVDGSYDDAFDLCLKVTETFGWYNRNTGYNPFTREGKKTCAFEIVEQLNWQVPDKVVVPVGDGNIISGIWKGFKDFYNLGLIDRLPKLIAAQSEKSAAIANAVNKKELVVKPVKATTLADSISVDIPRDGVCAVKSVLESKGIAVTVSDQEILTAIKETAQLTGIFSEPAGATGFAAVKKLLRQKKLKSTEKIVIVVTGNGLKDIVNAQKTVGEPIFIAPDLDEFKKQIKYIK